MEIKTSIDPWESLSPSSRHEEVIVTRTRVEHSRLTHLHKRRASDLLSVDLRHKLTIKHVTLECPKFNSSSQILGNPLTMQQALSEENTENIYNL